MSNLPSYLSFPPFWVSIQLLRKAFQTASCCLSLEPKEKISSCSGPLGRLLTCGEWLSMKTSFLPCDSFSMRALSALTEL